MGEQDAAGLAGTTWRLERVGDAPADEAVRSTLAFDAAGRVSGRGGVNRFGGSYRIAGGTIEFGEMMQTLMAGPEAAMDQERRFLDALRGTPPFAVDGDELTVGDAKLRRVEQLVVSGQVSYRQRIALPPGAVLIVSVLDVAKADVRRAAAETIAERRIEVEHQVPIPFELSVDADALDPAHRYTVAARIEVDGEPVWRSDAHHPVATDGPTEAEIDLVMVGR